MLRAFGGPSMLWGCFWGSSSTLGDAPGCIPRLLLLFSGPWPQVSKIWTWVPGTKQWGGAHTCMRHPAYPLILTRCLSAPRYPSCKPPLQTSSWRRPNLMTPTFFSFHLCPGQRQKSFQGPLRPVPLSALYFLRFKYLHHWAGDRTGDQAPA